ncbi:hypothetical protein NQ314_011317 [Rhamnusium bicolor]|uniref:Uncharacterized protein n=1 Tax=Rhamnusium bicolor TaxID=1586634 RepID=A0AAV8XJ66_9CUCU|nr:hypothetical protein NQ314_011317 [Rhamnusium bicolor]
MVRIIKRIKKHTLYDDDQTDPDILLGRPDEPSYYFEYENYDQPMLNKTDVIDENIKELLDNIKTVTDDFTKQAKQLPRKRRNVIAATNDGIVINSESYAERRARNNTRNKIHSRNGFAASAVSSESYFSRVTPWLSPRQYNADDTTATTSPYMRKHVKYPTRPPPPVFTRKSRVMHNEDKSKAFRQVVKKSSLKSGDVLSSNIYYLDEHDTTGFRVFKNREIILQCTVTAHSIEGRLKGNTCYTAGVEYLSENDRISLADITDGRYSLFEPGKSFFGLIKLGDVKIKQN